MVKGMKVARTQSCGIFVVDFMKVAEVCTLAGKPRSMLDPEIMVQGSTTLSAVTI